MTNNQGIASIGAHLFFLCAVILWTSVSLAESDTSVKSVNNSYFQREIKNNLPFKKPLFAENKLHSNQNACSVTLETIDLLQKINRIRAQNQRCGLKQVRKTEPLLPNCGLQKSAKIHARYLKSISRLQHVGINKETLGKRVSANQVKWQRVAENLAQGTSDGEVVLDLWLSSPRHCRNLMNPIFGAIGLAREGDTWVAIFARLVP